MRAPKTLAAVFADGSAVVFDVLPGDRPQWLRLPRPVKSPCVSLVVVQGAGAEEQTGLGEVGVYSDLDGQGAAGLARLAAAEDHVAGESAARALLLMGEGRWQEVLGALEDALLGASGPGRRRLQGVLVQLAQRAKAPPGAAQGKAAPGAAQAAAVLVKAIVQAPAEERPPLWQALDGLGEVVPLLALAQDASQPASLRGEALMYIGRRATPDVVRTLIDLDRGELPAAAERGLVSGLSAALRCLVADDPRGLPLRAALTAQWESERPDWRIEADLVEALADSAARCPEAGTSERAGTALWRSWPKSAGPSGGDGEAPRFLLRYRVLKGLAGLHVATAEIAALLKDVLVKESDPVLRRAAAEAAATMPGQEYGELARRGLSDSDPGVRLATLAGLAGRRDAATVIAVEQALAGDRWPQVRRAAAEARVAACAPGSTQDTSSLRRALRDADGEVRRLSLAGLAHCQGAGAAGILAETARSTEAAPEVRGQACALLAGVQGAAAQPALSEALLDALQDPAATERHAAMAATCARALGRVGDAAAVPALSVAAAEPLSPPIRLAAVESLGQVCTRGARDPKLRAALQTAAHDEDTRVKTAAAHALTRCK